MAAGVIRVNKAHSTWKLPSVDVRLDIVYRLGLLIALSDSPAGRRWTAQTTAIGMEGTPPTPALGPPPAYAAASYNRHPGIVCDQCQEPVGVRTRYKCAQCPNFDLCATCQANPAPAHWLATAGQRHTTAHLLLRIDDTTATMRSALTANRGNVVHHNTRCSHCHTSPIVGRRFLYEHADGRAQSTPCDRDAHAELTLAERWVWEGPHAHAGQMRRVPGRRPV